MKIKINQKILVLFLIFFFICLLSNEKILAQENAFASVPENLRARLVERLQLLIEYQQNRQWADHYDLLVSDITDKISKENYAKEQQRLEEKKIEEILVNFEIENATYATGAPFDVLIKGCGEFRRSKHVVKLQSIVEAYREKGDWYFTRISPNVAVDGDAPPCLSQSEKKSDCFQRPKFNFVFN